VFGSSFTFKQDNFQATMWSSGSPTNINDLFTRPADMVGLGGIEWGNDSGQLVGLGLKSSGAVHGYLLTPISAKPQIGSLTVRFNPVITAGSLALTANSNPVITAGSNLNLTASNSTNGNPSAALTFYPDSNGDGILEPGIHTFLGHGIQSGCLDFHLLQFRVDQVVRSGRGHSWRL
jgi:hypothetical protein